MTTSEAKRLKELEKENARLKKLLAEKELDIDGQKDYESFSDTAEASVRALRHLPHPYHTDSGGSRRQAGFSAGRRGC